MALVVGDEFVGGVDDGALRSEGAEAEVDAEDGATVRYVVDQRGDESGDGAGRSEVGGADGGFAGEDEVDVGGEVEFAPSELAHAEHNDMLGFGAEESLCKSHGRGNCLRGDAGDLGGGGEDVGGLGDLREDNAEHLEPFARAEQQGGPVDGLGMFGCGQTLGLFAEPLEFDREFGDAAFAVDERVGLLREEAAVEGARGGDDAEGCETVVVEEHLLEQRGRVGVEQPKRGEFRDGGDREARCDPVSLVGEATAEVLPEGLQPTDRLDAVARHNLGVAAQQRFELRGAGSDGGPVVAESVGNQRHAGSSKGGGTSIVSSGRRCHTQSRAAVGGWQRSSSGL